MFSEISKNNKKRMSSGQEMRIGPFFDYMMKEDIFEIFKQDRNNKRKHTT